MGKCTEKNIGTVPHTARDWVKFGSYISEDLKCHFPVKPHVKNTSQLFAVMQNFSYWGKTVLRKKKRGGGKRFYLSLLFCLMNKQTR